MVGTTAVAVEQDYQLLSCKLGLAKSPSSPLCYKKTPLCARPFARSTERIALSKRNHLSCAPRYLTAIGNLLPAVENKDQLEMPSPPTAGALAPRVGGRAKPAAQQKPTIDVKIDRHFNSKVYTSGRPSRGRPLSRLSETLRLMTLTSSSRASRPLALISSSNTPRTRSALL